VRRPNYARIYNELNKKDKEYELTTANALWAQKDFSFLDEYLNITERYYGGKATELDFITETEESRQIINTWVEGQTNNKIKDLIERGMIDPLTRLVLTNAIYFKGDWIHQFDKEGTSDMEFEIAANETVEVPMMYLDGVSFNYTETDELQVIELPYEGGEISMLVLLPKDNLESLKNNLSAEKIADYRAALSSQEVIVYLPKFSFETKYTLNHNLAEMGMPTAFSTDADFSGMDGRKDLFISFVVHQAFVDVNEEGTEASAATGVGMKLTAAIMEPTIFRADHPFIFIIQERDTGSILFLGRVVNPSE